MIFCPKCGSLLKPKMEGSRKLMACSCGYKSRDADAKISERKAPKAEQKIEVIEKNTDLEALPKMEAKCEKCGNNKAYFWLVQTRAGDEPETKFLKCEKCGHTWRDYD